MFKGTDIKAFKNKIWLSSPTMHGEELEYMTKAYETNWMSTVGENIDEVEHIAAEKSGVRYAVALSSCTAALHLCVKLAGERLYGRHLPGHGALEGKRVFCSDMTFDATVNPVLYEGGIPVFVDTDINTWNMDPKALEKAFDLYPDVRLVVFAELYGFPGGITEIREICEKRGALLIEDAAEAMGATAGGRQCGSFGDYSAVSYNGNKIITGSSGGCLLTDNIDDANRARKWSTQSREAASWYQHEETGYNYRMSNVVAGVVRGQYMHLEEHIAQKRLVYERYREGFRDLPVQMNPNKVGAEPNYWLSALIIDEDAMCPQVRDDEKALYIKEAGRSCPEEILEVLAMHNAEGRPVWKPMHMQPMYRNNGYVVNITDKGTDIFNRGICLPSDNKMTEEEQEKVIEIVRRCFD